MKVAQGFPPRTPPVRGGLDSPTPPDRVVVHSKNSGKGKLRRGYVKGFS